MLQLVTEKSNLKKLFRIVVSKSCPKCGKRALKKEDNNEIKCSNCGAIVETKVEDTSWFFSSQEKSVLLDLKKEIINKKREIRDRLLKIQGPRKLL